MAVGSYTGHHSSMEEVWEVDTPNLSKVFQLIQHNKYHSGSSAIENSVPGASAAVTPNPRAQAPSVSPLSFFSWTVSDSVHLNRSQDGQWYNQSTCYTVPDPYTISCSSFAKEEWQRQFLWHIFCSSMKYEWKFYCEIIDTESLLGGLLRAAASAKIQVTKPAISTLHTLSLSGVITCIAVEGIKWFVFIPISKYHHGHFCKAWYLQDREHL